MHREKYLHVAYVFSKVHKSKNNNNKQKFLYGFNYQKRCKTQHLKQ